MGAPLGFVERLELLPLHHETGAPKLSDQGLAAMKDKLARAMEINDFAVASDINVVPDLGQLS